MAQPWDSFGKNDAKAETPVLWPPHAKSWLIGKDSDAGRDWGQEEKGMTEDEMAGWHHRLDGCESEWTLGVGDGQGGLAYCHSWGRKESDTTERLNWTELMRSKKEPKLEFSHSVTSGGQNTGVSVLASFLPKNTQDWFPFEWTGWISLQSKGHSRVFSNATVQKPQFFGAQLSSQSNSHIHTNTRNVSKDRKHRTI